MGDEEEWDTEEDIPWGEHKEGYSGNKLPDPNKDKNGKDKNGKS